MEKLIYLIIFLLLSAAGIIIVRPDIPLREHLNKSGERKNKLRGFRQKGKTSQFLDRLFQKRRSLMASSGIPQPMLL